MYSQITSNKRKTILLIAIFVTIVLFLGWLFGELYQFGYAGLLTAACISIGMSLVSYYAGDKVALLASGAKGPIEKTDNPYIYRMVENLCITAGLPMPRVYIIPDTAPNAFATGRDPEHSSIALTTGLIEQLQNEELEGVIAHELSHIQNYDIRVMTIVIVLVGLVALLADFFLRFNFMGSKREREGNAGNILLLVGIILAILSPIIAELIKLAVSRKREFLADASGAHLTRYPEGLAKALEKISQHKQPLRRASNATAHLYIANPFGETRKKMSGLFSTHPPIEERIKALREMA